MTGVMVKKANEKKKERIVFLPFFCDFARKTKERKFHVTNALKPNIDLGLNKV